MIIEKMIGITKQSTIAEISIGMVKKQIELGIIVMAMVSHI